MEKTRRTPTRNGSTSVRDVDRLLCRQTVDASELVGLWEVREKLHWHEDRCRLESFVRRALSLGEYLLVCDATGKETVPDEQDFAFQFLRAQALGRVGSRPEAQEIIERLGRLPKLSTANSGDLRALAADLAWEAALEEDQTEQQVSGWKNALAAYKKLTAVRPADPLPVIRRAALETLLGSLPEAQREARQALRLCTKPVRAGTSQPIWHGYQAVAHLVLGDVERARAAVKEAIASDPRALPDHARLRHRFRMVNAALGRAASEYDEEFPSLNLVVYAGHKIDEPKPKRRRFPKDDVGRIQALVQWKLKELKALIGVGSGACGADLLFHEEMLARGGNIHLVLPWTKDRFLKNSVEPHEDAVGWAERFEKVWERAASRRVIGEFEPTSEDVGLSYARAVMAGRARLMARALNLDLIPLALWDRSEGTPGGTGGFIRFWQRHGARPAIIDLNSGVHVLNLESTEESPRTPAPAARLLTAPPLEQQVKAMLFADIKGYSQLPEHSIPAFVHFFMGGVSRLAAESRFPPLSVNTWGDAIYLVFDSAEGAGEFALDLMEFVQRGDWMRHDLVWHDDEGQTRPLNMRVGLHAGPVFVHFNPVVRQLGFTGAHVSRAARIEPIADVGKVFASEEFAALAAVEQARGFACEYVGTRKLAKKYPGDFLLYRLRRINRLPLDDLARAIHTWYCAEEERRGVTVETRPAMRQWDDLPEDYQRVNREAAAAIPDLLRKVGLSLEPAPPGPAEDFTFSDKEVEKMARLEHERYCHSRRQAGWRYGPERDEKKKLNPSLASWGKLSRVNRERTIQQVREISRFTALARLGIRRKR